MADYITKALSNMPNNMKDLVVLTIMYLLYLLYEHLTKNDTKY